MRLWLWETVLNWQQTDNARILFFIVGLELIFTVIFLGL